MSAYTYDPRYRQPSPEVLHRLDLSEREAERVETRKMYCPICGRMVSLIPVTQKEVVFVRCRKCKFEGALSPAYFRRMRQYQTYRSRNARNCRETEAAYGQDIYLH